MKIKTKDKKGISLIVLVITIIIMIILASAIIISLNNNGIIDNAKDAVDKTNAKQVEELANLAWGEAYASGFRTQTDLNREVKKALEKNNISLEDYYLGVTETGVTLGWVQKDNRTIVRGNQVLEIGDSINYHDAANENGTEKYTGGWKVLGAENGKIKILSNSIIDDDFAIDIFMGTEESDFKENLKIISKLNEESEPYGTGKGAAKARCITIEDIDFATGYNKNNYNKGQINEYGNTITYYWDNDSTKVTKPYYEYVDKVTGELVTGNLTAEHTQFNYILNGEIVENIKPSGLSSKQKIASFTSNCYTYDFDSLLNKNDVKEKKIYDMLCYSKTSYDGYWLASNYIDTNKEELNWGIYRLLSNAIIDTDIFASSWIITSGGSASFEYLDGIRVVVELNTNVVLTGSSSSGWNIV